MTWIKMKTEWYENDIVMINIIMIFNWLKMPFQNCFGLILMSIQLISFSYHSNLCSFYFLLGVSNKQRVLLEEKEIWIRLHYLDINFLLFYHHFTLRYFNDIFSKFEHVLTYDIKLINYSSMPCWCPVDTIFDVILI